MAGQIHNKEPCFNHFTINTGHNLVQTKEYLSEDPILHAKLKKLVKESLTQEGTKVIGNIRFRAVTEGDTYVGSVFSCIDGKEIPLLVTFGAKTEEGGKRVWKEFQDTCNNPDVVSMVNPRPRAPFVADFLFDDSLLVDIQAFDFFISGMSGSFCKYMGWAFLFSEALATR